MLNAANNVVLYLDPQTPRKGGAMCESGYETTNKAHCPMLSPLYWIEIQIQMTLRQI